MFCILVFSTSSSNTNYVLLVILLVLIATMLVVMYMAACSYGIMSTTNTANVLFSAILRSIMADRTIKKLVFNYCIDGCQIYMFTEYLHAYFVIEVIFLIAVSVDLNQFFLYYCIVGCQVYIFTEYLHAYFVIVLFFLIAVDYQLT